MNQAIREALEAAEEYLSSNVPGNSYGLLDKEADAERMATREKVRAALAALPDVEPPRCATCGAALDVMGACMGIQMHSPAEPAAPKIVEDDICAACGHGRAEHSDSGCDHYDCGRFVYAEPAAPSAEVRRVCCFIPCDKPAEWAIVPSGAKQKYDSYTDACAEHAEALGIHEGEARRISEGTAWLTTPPPEAAAPLDPPARLRDGYCIRHDEPACPSCLTYSLSECRNTIDTKNTEIATLRDQLRKWRNSADMRQELNRVLVKDADILRAKLEEAERERDIARACREEVERQSDEHEARADAAEQRIAEAEKERDGYRERLVRRVARMRALNRRLAAVQNGSLEELQTAVWCALPELAYLDPEDSLTAKLKGRA